MMRRLRQLLAPPAPPTPSEAGRALSQRSRAEDVRARRRAERDRIVKAHCAAILASMKPKESAHEQ